MLDPLAEYLAGLRLVDLYERDESQWRELLNSITTRFESAAASVPTGFLRAVRDCCQTSVEAATIPGFEPKVPAFVIEQLNTILDCSPIQPQEGIPASEVEAVLSPTFSSYSFTFDPTLMSEQG